jgi:hypothetical protein
MNQTFLPKEIRGRRKSLSKKKRRGSLIKRNKEETMNTYFDEFGHLVVDMEVKGGLDSKAVSAFIDTCFDGYICLPTEIAVQLGLLLFAYEPYGWK